MREILKVYAPAIVLIVIGFVIALNFVTPPPPKALRLATGQAGGYYDAAGQIYREILGRESIKVVLVETQGSIDNLQRLTSERDRVDVALLQGGLSSDLDTSRLFAIAGVFYEPVWVLARATVRAQRLAELRGAKIAIGAVGSGTRILARQLLAANGITEQSATFAELGTAAAAAALAQGTVDAAFIVVARPLPVMVDLLSGGKVRLLSFNQADALHMKFPFLTPVGLPMGAVNLEVNVPSTDLRLVAPIATLVAREDLHPVLVSLLLQAAHEAHSGPQFFAPAGMFPTRNHLDFPLHPDAKRYFDRGPSFLFRYLPFWIAVWLDRMVVLLIPLLTLLIPIARLAPSVYRWQVQRKIYRWYQQLRRLEAEAQTAPDAERRAEIRAELDTLQGRLATLKIPPSYTQQLYDLRVHLNFVRARAD